MLDFSTIEQFDKIATPFYYYDMDLLRKTVDHVAELAEQHDIKVHYAIKANVERRLLEYISSKGFGADCPAGKENERCLAGNCRPARTRRTASSGVV
jgi:diaminopimelate decarboxylase